MTYRGLKACKAHTQGQGQQSGERDTGEQNPGVGRYQGSFVPPFGWRQQLPMRATTFEPFALLRILAGEQPVAIATAIRGREQRPMVVFSSRKKLG